MKHITERMTSTVIKSLTLGANEKGGYAAFYFVGEDAINKIEQLAPSDSVLSLAGVISAMKDFECKVFVKAGTVKPRTSFYTQFQDPFKLRCKELIKVIGEAFSGTVGKTDGAGLAAFKLMAANPAYQCVILMEAVSVDYNHIDDSTIEHRVAHNVNLRFGLPIENRVNNFKVKDSGRRYRKLNVGSII